MEEVDEKCGLGEELGDTEHLPRTIGAPRPLLPLRSPPLELPPLPPLPQPPPTSASASCSFLVSSATCDSSVLILLLFHCISRGEKGKQQEEGSKGEERGRGRSA